MEWSMPSWSHAVSGIRNVSNILKMKLYNLESCPYCLMVQRKLDELGLEYEKIDVPYPYDRRTEVIAVSGQPLVPVLVDGDTVLDDENKIIDYLQSTYGKNEG
jgi:glutathione S-transferase